MRWSSWVTSPKIPVRPELPRRLAAIRQISAWAGCVLFDWWESKSLHMSRRVLQGRPPFEAPPPQVCSLLLGCIIALLAWAAGRLGWVYRNLIIQQLMSPGGPAWIATVRLFTSWLIYYVHSQAIKQEVRLLQSGFSFKQLLLGLKCLESETGGNYFVLTMEINTLKC